MLNKNTSTTIAFALILPGGPGREAEPQGGKKTAGDGPVRPRAALNSSLGGLGHGDGRLHRRLLGDGGGPRVDLVYDILQDKKENVVGLCQSSLYRLQCLCLSSTLSVVSRLPTQRVEGKGSSSCCLSEGVKQLKLQSQPLLLLQSSRLSYQACDSALPLKQRVLS
jgi:hypothetical protein